MASPGKLVVRAAALPVHILRYLSQNPIVTGTLFYLLTRAPAHIRERVLGPLRPYLLSKNADARLAATIRVLRVLLVLGISSRISQLLDRLALNYWHFRRPGAPWRFGDAQKSELVLITGGCSGFGYEMVKGFARVAKVVLLDVSDLPEDLAKLDDVHYYRCDVTDFDALQALTAEIKSTHGNPSVLINNAGIANGKTVHDLSADAADRLFKVNLVSHFVLIKEFLPGMLAAQKGHIVTIASMASFIAGPGLLDYCCSKVGALYLNDGLRAELFTRHGPAGHSICTTSVHPSWHSTGLVKPLETQLNKFGIFPDPPANVAKLVIEQVVAARSGQIFVPRDQERAKNLRSWPLWAQDLIYGYPWSGVWSKTLEFKPLTNGGKEGILAIT